MPDRKCLTTQNELRQAEYRPCKHPACLRKVGGTAAYCCGGCSLADTPPKYDPDGYHSPECNARSAERGEFAWAEWARLTEERDAHAAD